MLPAHHVTEVQGPPNRVFHPDVARMCCTPQRTTNDRTANNAVRGLRAVVRAGGSLVLRELSLYHERYGGLSGRRSRSRPAMAEETMPPRSALSRQTETESRRARSR